LIKAKASWKIWTFPRPSGRTRSKKKVNVDFPLWLIHSLDKEAKQRGGPRQSIIKIWLAERLQKFAASSNSKEKT
jgi:hypothetical protein